MSCKLEGKSAQTIDGYERILRRFANFLGGREDTPQAIRAFLTHAKETYKLSQAVVKKYEIALKSYYHWQVEEGFVDTNPMKLIRIAKPPVTIVKTPSPEQLKFLLSNLKDRKLEDCRDKAIVLLFLDCGLRCSECANLRLEDIDIKRDILRIMGKGSKERLARMGIKTQKALWKYMALRANNDSPYL